MKLLSSSRLLLMAVILATSASWASAAEIKEGGHHGGGHGYQGHRGHQGHHRHNHDFPPVMHSFHNVMAPLVHSAPGEARMKAICDSSARLTATAKDVETTTPPQGREQAWQNASAKLSEVSRTIAGDCAEGGFDAEVLLGQLHQAFGELIHAAR